MRSLQSKLILATVLWTAGLLMLMHLFTMMALHFVPRLQDRHAAPAWVMAMVLMIGGPILLFHALRPFRMVRRMLTEVRLGKSNTLRGSYPSEIQPLVDDLNGLLEDREAAVKRAIATAGDLAHGLKTPLAVLSQEADRMEAEGNAELAGRIAQQVERMTRQVNYHLARARSAQGPGGAPPCPVESCAAGVVRTVLTIYAERKLGVSSNIDPDICALVRREDLEEILGNLLDNACKWAKSQMALKASVSDSTLVLTVDDDGPGLEPSARHVVLERGVRMDEAAPGSGLGLGIVRDLAELYRGSISLDDSPLGGLRVQVSLPGSRSSAPI
jgi:signal transduction histidine kinase